MTRRAILPIVHRLDRVYETGVRLTPRELHPLAARLKRSTRLPKWSLVIEPQAG